MSRTAVQNEPQSLVPVATITSDLVGDAVTIPNMKGIVGLLLLVGFVVVYWQWVLAAVVLVLIVRAAPVAWRELQAERAVEVRRRADLVARADEQHLWATAGDGRGTYGEYTPASL